MSRAEVQTDSFTFRKSLAAQVELFIKELGEVLWGYRPGKRIDIDGFIARLFLASFWITLHELNIGGFIHVSSLLVIPIEVGNVVVVMG